MHTVCHIILPGYRLPVTAIIKSFLCVQFYKFHAVTWFSYALRVWKLQSSRIERKWSDKKIIYFHIVRKNQTTATYYTLYGLLWFHFRWDFLCHFFFQPCSMTTMKLGLSFEIGNEHFWRLSERTSGLITTTEHVLGQQQINKFWELFCERKSCNFTLLWTMNNGTRFLLSIHSSILWSFRSILACAPLSAKSSMKWFQLCVWLKSVCRWGSGWKVN